MIIEVMDWGDFDIPYTKWIGENKNYISDNEFEKELLVRLFVESIGATDVNITPHGATGFETKRLYDLPNLFIHFLKKKGFKKVKTSQIQFSD